MGDAALLARHGRYRVVRLLVGLLLSVTLVWIAAVLVACGTDHESFYLSLADADKDGGISHGWIPDYLPASSHAIHEAHDQSPEYQWCTFEFSPSDTERLRKTLQPVDAPLPVRRIPSPHLSWWPSMLTGNLDDRRIRSAGLELYAAIEPGPADFKSIYFFAIDWRHGRAYFYSTWYDESRQSAGSPVKP